jgi:hypothetical protein
MPGMQWAEGLNFMNGETMEGLNQLPQGKCCDNGNFGQAHLCQKQPGWTLPELAAAQRNGAGIPLDRLRRSTGRPKGARNLNAKHPSSIARSFKKAGLDWAQDFALAIKANNRLRIKLWLRLLPYLITTTNKQRVKRWKGKASKAALIALQTLEGK